jgi:DNA-binding IclR family transcriptional regulator
MDDLTATDMGSFLPLAAEYGDRLMLVKQAVNTLQILEYFSERLRPATLAEIADDLGWPRSSTFNLVGTLVDRGYLYQPRSRGGYYPSPRWAVLAQAVSDAEPLRSEIVKLALDLAHETGETTVVAARSGVNAVFLAVIESRHSVRYSAKIGDCVPIHASSVGRALLAQIPYSKRQALYRRISFERYSPTSPTSPDKVEAELAHAIELGHHQSNAEYLPDLVGVSLPLPIPSSQRLLSILVVGPVSRCLERRDETAESMKKHIEVFEDSIRNGLPEQAITGD